jgi:hypothetical protein
MRQALVHRVEEARHLFGRFTLDAHGQAKAADFEVGHRAVQHLAQQVGGLRARQRAGAVLAAADFLDVLANTHGPDCPRMQITSCYELKRAAG